MPRLSAPLAFILATAGFCAQAETLKALSFEGVVASGGDWSGNVFTTTPAYLNGMAVSGRFVYDLDKIVGNGVSSAGGSYADYDDPLHPAGGAYVGSTTGPFLRGFITINGKSYEFENQAQPTLPGPIRQRVMLDDHPEYDPWDTLSASLTSYRPPVCFGCSISEFLTLSVAGVPGGFLSSENFGQNFDVAIVNNIYSYAQFQVLSGYQVNAGTYIPSMPNFGVESYHYASGNITLTRLSLQDVAAVPEPGSWALMLAGMVGLAAWQRRRNLPA